MLALASSLTSTGCLNFQSASETTPTPEADSESTLQQSPQPQTTATPATNELRSRIAWETSLDVNPSLIDHQAKIGDKIIITNVRGETQTLNKSDGSAAWSVSIPNYSNATNIYQLDGMFMASNWGADGNKIHAYDIETSTKQLTVPEDLGLAVDSEMLYYGRDPPEDSETKEIVAQQRENGDIQWQTKIPYARGSKQGQEILETESSIFTPSVEKLRSDQASGVFQERVYEISKSSGEELWSQNFRKPEVSPSNSDVHLGAYPHDKRANILIIQVGNKKTVCFDFDSRVKKWEIDGEGYLMGVFGSTVVFEFLIDPRLVGINISTGERIWTETKSSFFDWDSDSNIAYYNDGAVVSVDGQTGSESWRESVVDELTAWSGYSAPVDVMSESHFWLANEKRLIGLRPNGNIILDQEWEFDGNILDVIAGQNRIFVSTDEGVWRALLIE